MVTSKQCLEAFGEPDENMQRKFMTLLRVPKEITDAIPNLPSKIFCHKLLKPLLLAAFKNIIERGLAKELLTWDGCFGVRLIRGGKSLSLHSWGLAIDINRKGNELGKIPTISKELVACFTDAGFYWGGWFKRLDGMHFQIAKLQ